MRSCAFYRCGALPAKRVSVHTRVRAWGHACAYRVRADGRRTLPPLCVRLRTFVISLNPQTTSVRVGTIWIRYRSLSRARARLITLRFTISIRSAFGRGIDPSNVICRDETHVWPFHSVAPWIIRDPVIIYTSEINLSYGMRNLTANVRGWIFLLFIRGL